MSLSLSIRRACSQDAEAVWRWRNDPAARAASLDARPIALEDHLSWFAGVVADPARILLIAEADGAPSGAARLDRQPSGALRVSLVVAPERKGRGIGSALLRHAVTLGEAFVAEVRADNLASIRLFESCGFHRGETADGVIMYHFNRGGA